jgi:hypothetical protein
MATCQGCAVDLPPKKWKGPDRKWCSNRCRKQTLYSGTCRECGARTNGSDGPGTASDLCCHCAPAANAKWTRDVIIAAIQGWAREHGSPPAATDWNSALARRRGRPPRDIEKYPPLSVVQDMFGSWSAGIEAAGFTPTPIGKYERGPQHRNDERRAQVVRLYVDEGLSSPRIAEIVGINRSGVLRYLHSAGVDMRTRNDYKRAA